MIEKRRWGGGRGRKMKRRDPREVVKMSDEGRFSRTFRSISLTWSSRSTRSIFVRFHWFVWNRKFVNLLPSPRGSETYGRIAGVQRSSDNVLYILYPKNNPIMRTNEQICFPSENCEDYYWKIMPEIYSRAQTSEHPSSFCSKVWPGNKAQDRITFLQVF